MAERIDGEEVGGVSADRYKQADVEQYIATAELDWIVDWRGVGTGKDGSADIKHFQAEVLEGILEMEDSLLMDSAISESVIRRDGNNNAALNKARHKGRNDPLQAALLAVGPGRRWREAMEDAEDDIGNYVLTEMYQ